MAKIILEDMKPNRGRKIPQKETGVVPSKNLISALDNYKDEKTPIKNTVSKVDIDIIKTKKEETPVYLNSQEQSSDIDESKTDRYFKSKSSYNPRIERTPQVKKKHGLINKYIFIIFILVIIIGAVYWGGDKFQKADIFLTAKHQDITYVSKQFLASKDTTISGVDFEIMIINDKKLKNIVLTEPKDVSIKAVGSVTLYNVFGATPQKLLAGTFLSDENGKAYKTNSIVTIPGYKLDSNKKIIPSQIDVDITAFLPGDTYNGSPTDFSITSFKNTPKSSKIYGKLKTPLTGGASGSVYTLNDEDISHIDSIAQSSFKNDLLNKAKAQVPPGYILYPNAMTFTYKIDSNVSSKTPEAEVGIEGDVSVLLLSEKSLKDNITKISLPSIKGDELKEINILNLENLSFNFTDKEQLITKDMTSVTFYLTGKLDAAWSPNIDILKTKLVGTEKSSVLPIFRQDPGISSALIKIFPPWQRHTPEDINKINIIVD